MRRQEVLGQDRDKARDVDRDETLLVLETVSRPRPRDRDHIPVCKQSTPRSRQITTTPHHSISTGRMLFLMPNQHCQSTEGHTISVTISHI